MTSKFSFAKAGILALSLVILTACGPKAPSATSPSGDATKPSTESAGKEAPQDSNWTITVDDSSTVEIGPMKLDIAINMTAVNTSGKITGLYTGSATTKANSHAENVAIKKGTGSMTAPVEGKSTSLTFNISPYVADEDKLAPLVPGESDDGKLAPLVPNDDDKLAPLTDPKNPPQYEGEGSMTLQSSGTATATVRGYSASKGIGNTSVNPLKVTIMGSKVRLAVTIPQIGTVYFDGTIASSAK